MSDLPSVKQIVDWYLHPAKALKARKKALEAGERIKPTRPYDYLATEPEDLFVLTLEYLLAATPPLEHGQPRRFTDSDRKQNIFWEIHKETIHSKDRSSEGTKTSTTFLYYGFDASGALTVERVYRDRFEDPYQNEYIHPNWNSIPVEHRVKLVNKLKAFRKSLAAK